MREYLYWKQIQDRLSAHAAVGNEPKNFYTTVRELWEEGAAHTAEELPPVSFAEWDAVDYDWFDRIFDRVPVELDSFYRDFEQNIPANRASEEAITPDILVLRIAYDQAIGIHRHEYFEIDYIMQGTAELCLEGERRPLHGGDFIFLSPGLKHDLVPTGGSHVISVVVPSATVEQTLYRLLRRDTALTNFFNAVMDKDRIGYLLVPTPEERRIREIIRGLLHEFFAREEFSADILPDHLAILFAFILRRCGDRYEWHGNEDDRGGVQVMLAALKYIRDHYNTLTLNELAERFHYEPSYLGKQIKAATGKNYTDIIREIRIEQAKYLLRTTELTMDQIAERIGYTGRVHFFRSFRKVTGITPGTYRKEKRIGEGDHIVNRRIL